MAIYSQFGKTFPLGWQGYIAIAGAVLILVLCILLFFKIKYNVIIGLIMTGIIEVRISLAGGFWNTALDLAALCFASSLKFISYQLTPLYYVEQFPL
uniref:Uncharacterized protein n=1 Tax=Trichobilharzia regenti TaxID=157069 RepID=A0AA85IW68_TRIRE|nr:unnamed protein product [Trichobilharzia regenti]